jgi:hypothetical protein
MTNLLFVTVVVTNWIRFSGDVKIEGRTNYLHEHQVITTSNLVFEITRCTNSYPFMVENKTNGLTRWTPFPIPPLPGQREKE